MLNVFRNSAKFMYCFGVWLVGRNVGLLLCNFPGVYVLFGSVEVNCFSRNVVTLAFVAPRGVTVKFLQSYSSVVLRVVCSVTV